jgi:hypothetical protein
MYLVQNASFSKSFLAFFCFMHPNMNLIACNYNCLKSAQCRPCLHILGYNKDYIQLRITVFYLHKLNSLCCEYIGSFWIAVAYLHILTQFSFCYISMNQLQMVDIEAYFMKKMLSFLIIWWSLILYRCRPEFSKETNTNSLSFCFRFCTVL